MDDPKCTDEYLNSVNATISNKFPRLRFPGLQEMNFVSCKTGKGIKEFTDKLVEIVKKEQFSPILSEPWIKLHEYIKKAGKGKDYIEWKEYEKWAQICDVELDQLQLATEFLSDIGTLIHFNDARGNLKDLVILNPQWLADVMSCLITTKHNFAKDGLLPRNAIRQIFSAYPKKHHEQFLVLLENFSILNPLEREFNGQSCFLVPSLLPEQTPSSEIAKHWPTITPVHFIEYGRVREFSFLPLGLFARMMISVLHIEKVSGLVFWRNGLLIQQDKQLALLNYQSDVFTLSFHVRVPIDFRSSRENVSLLRELVEIVETIIGCYYPKLGRSTHRFVTCTHCKELRESSFSLKPFLFTEDSVIESINQGIPALYCHHIQSSSRCVSVIDLAPDLAFCDLPSINSNDLTIDKVLGQGGFGTVYKGTWNDRAVAIKELNDDSDGICDGGSLDSSLLSASQETTSKFQEFQRECWIMSTMVHPNITQLYGVSVVPVLRMVMQFCPGGDLFEFLHPKDKITGKQTNATYDQISWNLRYKIGLDIAKGMRYLQSIKPPIIHRDLRSLNIFLIDPTESSKLRAQVADFGLSRRVAYKIKGFLGTWQWLAPEVINTEADQYDQRADIYSYGIVLWEIVTSLIPFDEYYFDKRFGKKIGPGESIDNYDINVITIKKAIINDHLRPSIPSHVPDRIKSIILSCWKNNPNDRPSFDFIVKELSDLANEEILTVDEEVNKFLERNIHKSVIRDSHIFHPKPKISNIYSLKKQFSIPENEIKPLQSQSKSSESIFSDKYFDSILMVSCFYDNNKTIWVGYGSGHIGVFNLDGACTCLLHAHSGRISSLIQVKDSIWSSGEDGMIYVWDPISFGVLGFWKASQSNNEVVSGLQAIQIPKLTRTNSRLQKMREWKKNSDKKKSKSKKSKSSDDSSDNGKPTLCVWSWLPISRTIRIWDSKDFTLRDTLIVGDQKDSISCLAYCNNMVWIGTKSGKVFLYEVTSLDLIGCFNLQSSVECLITEGPRVWSATYSGLIQIWEWDEQLLRQVGESDVHNSRITSLSLMPLNKQVWSGDFNGLIIVWDTKVCCCFCFC